MRVLITGGTGTISSGLVKQSVEKNYETYAITRGSNNTRNIKGAKYIHADIWNKQEIDVALKNLKFDVIVECLVMNVNQLKVSLENFSNRCKQYVFISTAAIYNRDKNRRIKETDPKEFEEWSYTKNKIECEKYLKEFSEKKGLNYTIIRPTVTYGDYRIPFPIATRTPGWTFFDRMKKGQLMLASDNVKFSVIHISDFSKMVVELFENDRAMNEAFHITSNNNDIYWDDVIKISAKLLQVAPKIIHVSAHTLRKIWPSIYEEIVYHKNTTQIFDSKKIQDATGIEAKINIDKGIEIIVSSMEKEFRDEKLSLDEKWNDYCNATIYYAYSKKLLSDDEMKTVERFINENGDTNLKESYKKIKKYNRLIKIYGIKGKMKRILKKLLK